MKRALLFGASVLVWLGLLQILQNFASIAQSPAAGRNTPTNLNKRLTQLAQATSPTTPTTPTSAILSVSALGSFVFEVGQAASGSQALSVANNGAPLSFFTSVNSSGWLQVSPSAGSTPATLTVS